MLKILFYQIIHIKFLDFFYVVKDAFSLRCQICIMFKKSTATIQINNSI